jgi:hypothetical protein
VIIFLGVYPQPVLNALRPSKSADAVGAR